MSNDDPDLACVARCRDGDLDAFGVLVEKYQKPVFNVVFHMVRSYEDAREISQQVFTRAFEHLDSFDQDRRFFSWLYRIAMNESLNFLQSRRELVPLEGDFSSRELDPEQTMNVTEIRAEIRGALLSLKPEYRSVVVLRHFLQFSYRDAAEILQLPEKTVKSRLFTARQMLRDALLARGYQR